MIKPAQITIQEKDLLLDWYKDGVSNLIRDRAHAILLSSQRKSAGEIAQILYRNVDVIRAWLSKFNRRRISSLFDKYQGNTNASKLSREQKERIKQVLSCSPSDYDIPEQFWQVKDLKRWIKAEFGIVYESDRSYHFLFKLGRFSWKLPDKFDIKRDDELITKRVNQIREEIKPLLKSDDWIVITADETRLVWESEARRAWLKTNQKTIIRVHRSKDYQSFLGCLNLRTGKCHLFSLSWQNQRQIIKALRKLKVKYPGKRICLVWDNAKWHKGKLLRRQLSRYGSLTNFHLINFPPYAPDTNPQEHVWREAKDYIAHKPTVSFKQKVNNFKLAVIARRFNYQI